MQSSCGRLCRRPSISAVTCDLHSIHSNAMKGLNNRHGATNASALSTVLAAALSTGLLILGISLFAQHEQQMEIARQSQKRISDEQERDRQREEREKERLAGRVGTALAFEPTVPSSNRTCRSPASGFPNNCHR